MAVKNFLVVFGTRPEAIKLCPLLQKAKQYPDIKLWACSTGQHREMLRPVLDFFEITPDYDLDLMKPGQGLHEVTQRVLSTVTDILKQKNFDGVIVQGDTTTCFTAGLAAFYQKIPVYHVEAGLRSGDIFSPFPEEFNRQAVGLFAHAHFAPTEGSKAALLSEGYNKNVFVTGNTGIDALFWVKQKIEASDEIKKNIEEKFRFLDPSKKLILTTVHRRESFGEPMENVLKGLLNLSQREDVQILFPMHLNPQVRAAAQKILGNNSQWVGANAQTNFWLCEPLDYISFVYIMSKSHLIITDSGGVQEEAPSLGVPVLVARENTERPEAIQAGTSKFISLHSEKFTQEATEVLDTPAIYNKMAQAQNPFGNGDACTHILELLLKL